MRDDPAVLAARIRSELIELEQVIERTERLFSKFQAQNDEDYLDGVALNLHGFYGGTERIFEEIAREIDENIPSDSQWHRSLLIQMSAEIVGKRPKVITRDTRNCLDDYRGFRHVVRNVYTFSLRPSRLKELVADLPNCYSNLKEDLMIFCHFLEKLVVDNER